MRYVKSSSTAIQVFAFVSYGSAMGARGVQQLRQTAIELQLAPIRASVHIPVATLWAHFHGGDVDAGLAEIDAPAGALERLATPLRDEDRAAKPFELPIANHAAIL
jgi:hypothetical protein